MFIIQNQQEGTYEYTYDTYKCHFIMNKQNKLLRSRSDKSSLNFICIIWKDELQKKKKKKNPTQGNGLNYC